MKAIILAGGKGNRFRPLTNITPKPMLEIANKPILEHIIHFLKSQDITEFIISVCYLKKTIIDYFGNGKNFGVTIEYIFEDEHKPLGTAGAIATAKKYIDSPFIVTSGDSLRQINIANMITFHQQKNAFATLSVYKRFGDNPKSMIVFNHSKKITQFIERPSIVPNDYIWSNGFFYIFEPDIFEHVQENLSQDFGKDIFPALLKKNKALFAYPTRDYFLDIADSSKLQEANATYPHLES